MYFYIDESGQTGNNLFDKQQPNLYYGVISCQVNLDVLARSFIENIRKSLTIDRLHASQLGNEKLTTIIPSLIMLQRKFNIDFDFYKVNKEDYSVISFFDQIFDQGLNPAVPWTGYWTPLRYILLLKLSTLLNEPQRKEAWEIRICKNDKQAEKRLQDLCRDILTNLTIIPDARSREIIKDVLDWVIAHPAEIGYNSKKKHDLLQISPNLIGFQSVLHGIAKRVENTKKKVASIIVDRQEQFNSAQEWISEIYKTLRDIPFTPGPGLPEMDLKHLPSTRISCTPGTQSVGLELVDIYLWIFKRMSENEYLDNKFNQIVNIHSKRLLYDEISLKAIEERWTPFFESLPDPTGDQLQRAMDLLRTQEKLRKAGVAQNA